MLLLLLLCLLPLPLLPLKPMSPGWIWGNKPAGDEGDVVLENGNSRGLAIRNRDSFLLYEYPGIKLLVTGSLTIELWYRTPWQPNVTTAVAIFSNDRKSAQTGMYQRWFRILLQPTGRVTVDFHAVDTRRAGYPKPGDGIESQVAIDDDRWHHIAVVRSREEQRLRLYVDFGSQGEVEIPNGIDIMDQEQRTIIGGGNDRRFRECYIDELRVWRGARVIDRRRTCAACSDDNLVAFFDFEEDGGSWPAVVRDCSNSRGHALRVGEELIKGDPFTSGAPRAKACPNTSREVHGRRDAAPLETDTDTVILTSLYWRCGGGGGLDFDTGGMLQFEAYIGPLWLDVNRLNMKMVVMVDCLDDERIARYTTPNVQFVKVEPYDRGLPVHCSPVNQRFLVFRNYLESGALDAFSHVVMLDFRDSRVNHSPRAYWKANPDIDLVLQTVEDYGVTCGGFQAGTNAGIRHLLDKYSDAIVADNCRTNDQDILYNLVANKRPLAALRIVFNTIINRQKTRVFDERDPFEHGAWWRPRNNWQSPDPDGYPRGIP